MKVEIYSDVACPWCYVGTERLNRALGAFPGADQVEVVFRPFQLAPEASTTPRPMSEALREKFGDMAAVRAAHERLAALGAAEGIAFDFESAQSVNTFTAHRLLWLAEREGGAATQRRLKTALLRAQFTEGADVGDPSVLVERAVAAGLDRERVTAFLAGDEGAAEVARQIDEARRIGVTAVPTFVFEGTWAVQGAQEASVMLQVLEQVAAELARDDDPRQGAATGTDAATAGRQGHDHAGGDDACADGVCAV
ncbi:DsbA family oxidoreductase [Allostreptomyces psammosilenae]|uniref:Putative DsbA family dithiol-disulfide isomerase n=1 Tax=Allostreptomyces psammosilenae TaxID=1892865 RepID=A0A852ZV74_9ACTN|nr:DsbA family oxidoreductase [Allostreptomyces psammosilenae]NYI05825.1 putative DsbA family dithiol-disulfide isomerase [Allostreptomyces psammosilenae]